MAAPAAHAPPPRRPHGWRTELAIPELECTCSRTRPKYHLECDCVFREIEDYVGIVGLTCRPAKSATLMVAPIPSLCC